MGRSRRRVLIAMRDGEVSRQVAREREREKKAAVEDLENVEAGRERKRATKLKLKREKEDTVKAYMTDRQPVATKNTIQHINQPIFYYYDYYTVS